MSTILVVDDEPGVRRLVTRILEREGHRVVACADADQALALTETVDVLVVDFTLPHVNGQQLTERLRERMPGLPALLMSGYPQRSDLMLSPPSMFLQKPMTSAAVIEAVNQLLKS